MDYLHEVKDGNLETNAKLTFGFWLDIMSLKLFSIKYPAFCTVDIADIIVHGHMYNCGYAGEEYRVEPLHSRDPYMDFSGLRFWFPSLYGRHSMLDLNP